MSDDAVYCQKCGNKNGDAIYTPQSVHGGEMVTSTKIFSNQLILIYSIIFIGMGLMVLIMSTSIPNDDFFDSSRSMFIMGGLVLMGIGAAIYVFGNNIINKKY
jgi:predicted membrane channel-forming protein YqfA (hemolysin III family)